MIPDPNQLSMIHQFNAENRTKFNPELFADSDEGIIDELKNVILSIQRDRFFTIKVEGFSIIEDYETIMKTLYEAEGKFSYKNKGKENVYSFINLKDSDVRLLVVNYYISIKEESEHITVYIAVPRTVDRYYFRIGGNIVSAVWQIVDASTYNSSTSSSKKHSVTLKTTFMPIRIYRYTTNHKNSLRDHFTGEQVKCTFYTSYIFKKSLPVMKYLLAKFGYYGTAQFLHLDLINIYDHEPEWDDNQFVFNKLGMYISVPKQIYLRDHVVQSFIYTIYNTIDKNTEYSEFFSMQYWLLALAKEFNNQDINKGLSILDSLEFIYDISTKMTLMLPEEVKVDIYHVLKWIIGEFNNLMIKDNLNVSIKRIRRAPYIASLYAMRLSTSMYRVSDIGKKANIDSIKKAIVTNPMYLINAISSCKLINYRNFVGDLDAMVALKFTYKGISGIGENSNSMPNIYRAVNPTQLGHVDLDSSSPGDPGASGTIVPKAKIYQHGLFSDFQEPNYWEDSFIETVDNYKDMIGLKQALIIEQNMLGVSVEEKLNNLTELINSTTKLIQPLIKATVDEEIIEGIPLEESGLICYESDEGDNKEE